MNFAQGFLLELIHVVIGFLLFVDLRASAQWGFVQGSQAGVIFVFVVVGVMAVWAAVMLYSFSMLSRYDNNIIVNIKKCSYNKCTSSSTDYYYA